MEEEAYNVTAYCESAVNGSEPLCALYDTLYEVSEKVDGIESGVNSFFLLFGVSDIIFCFPIAKYSINNILCCVFSK